MKDIINYYYDLTIDKFDIKNQCIIMESKGRTLIVKKLIDPDKFAKVINYLSDLYYKIVLTKDNQYYFEYNSDTYIIFEIHDASMKKLSDFDVIIVNEEVSQDYGSIWENNLEYYMTYISSFGVEHKDLLNDFNYYIGMAENAIMVYNKAKKMSGSVRVTLNHYRIRYPNYYLYYYDPTEVTIDVISRDISGYIKSKFFSEGITLEETLSLINKYQLNEKEVCFMISRLIYPNFYFDFIKENRMDNKKNTMNILKKRNDYEHFLNELLKQIKTTNLSININWLS